MNRIHAQIHNVGLHWSVDVCSPRMDASGCAMWRGPCLGRERRLFIDMQWALIDQLVPMIKTLDRRVEHVGREIPAVALLETVPGIGPYRALLIATETLHHTIPHARPPGQLRRSSPRSSQSGLRPVRHGSIPAGANRWLRGTFVRAVVSHVAHRARQLAIAVVRTDQVASRVAGRSGRYPLGVSLVLYTRCSVRVRSGTMNPLTQRN